MRVCRRMRPVFDPAALPVFPGPSPAPNMPFGNRHMPWLYPPEPGSVLPEGNCGILSPWFVALFGTGRQATDGNRRGRRGSSFVNRDRKCFRQSQLRYGFRWRNRAHTGRRYGLLALFRQYRNIPQITGLRPAHTQQRRSTGTGAGGCRRSPNCTKGPPHRKSPVSG
jgi:hypothetical protein